MTVWHDHVREWYEAADERGTLFLCFPAYRPELCRHIAERLGLAFLDYRDRFMRPLGWRASSLTTDDLEAAIDEAARDSGAIVHNAEALLALLDAPARRDWLKAIASRRWPNRVILPLFLFAADAPVEGRLRRLELQPADLPAESFLHRLASLG